MDESRAEKLSEKRRKTHENNSKLKDEDGDKENMDPTRQTNKMENNTLKDKEIMVNSWFNMAEMERAQKGAPILEKQLGSKDDLESPKPQNVNSSLELEESTNTKGVQSVEPALGAKPHYTRGKRTHLELVFSSEDKQQYYAKEDETNPNGNDTVKEQNNEDSKESDGLVQDTLVGDDIEMLSQEGESLETMLEKDRNEENQQEIQDNMLQQVEANAGIHQDMPVEQVDLKETNHQAQKSTDDTGTNPLNLAHEPVQTQLQGRNVEVQEDDGFTMVTHKKLRTKKNIYSHDSRSRPYVNNRPSRDGPWKRIGGSINQDVDKWPWEPEDIKVANVPGNEYTVQKGAAFLKNKSLLMAIQKQENDSGVNSDL
ncbi:15091_t:CDS:2 [Dentiscutata heterogama]|uniref:15091_t:CDS:1 n=1 Tax=Dentiscutata heterogama TaxID=1316150 RepID=A0ACA9KAA1_9GLOM|nr:15091_t:CDS:2 [Dentiscutata heterogama]